MRHTQRERERLCFCVYAIESGLAIVMYCCIFVAFNFRGTSYTAVTLFFSLLKNTRL